MRELTEFDGIYSGRKEKLTMPQKEGRTAEINYPWDGSSVQVYSLAFLFIAI